MFIAIVFFFDLGSMLHGKQEQVHNFAIVGGTAKHCVDQYMVLFRYCSLAGNTAMPGGLRARICHTSFLVYFGPLVFTSYYQTW